MRGFFSGLVGRAECVREEAIRVGRNCEDIISVLLAHHKLIREYLMSIV